MNVMTEQDISLENMIDVLHACADLLLEKEKISQEEFEALFPGRCIRGLE